MAHSGAMIALRVPDPENYALNNPADAEAITADDLHMTLAYLGEAAEITPEQRSAVLDAIQVLADTSEAPTALFPATTGVFAPDPEAFPEATAADALAPYYAAPQPVEPFSKLREDMLVHLGARGVGNLVSTKHPNFNPHVTLTYAPLSSPPDIDHLPTPFPTTFSTLIVRFGDEEHVFPLQSTGNTAPLALTASVRHAIKKLSSYSDNPKHTVPYLTSFYLSQTQVKGTPIQTREQRALTLTASLVSAPVSPVTNRVTTLINRAAVDPEPLKAAFHSNRALALSAHYAEADDAPLRASAAQHETLRAIVADGNSRAARSMRARKQLRDRYGRWIEMGGGIRFKIRKPGAPGGGDWYHGKAVGADTDTGEVIVELDDGRTVRAPADKVEKIAAILPESAQRRLGIFKGRSNERKGAASDERDDARRAAENESPEDQLRHAPALDLDSLPEVSTEERQSLDEQGQEAPDATELVTTLGDAVNEFLDRVPDGHPLRNNAEQLADRVVRSQQPLLSERGADENRKREIFDGIADTLNEVKNEANSQESETRAPGEDPDPVEDAFSKFAEDINNIQESIRPTDLRAEEPEPERHPNTPEGVTDGGYDEDGYKLPDSDGVVRLNREGDRARVDGQQPQPQPQPQRQPQDRTVRREPAPAPEPAEPATPDDDEIREAQAFSPALEALDAYDEQIDQIPDANIRDDLRNRVQRLRDGIDAGAYVDEPENLATALREFADDVEDNIGGNGFPNSQESLENLRSVQDSLHNAANVLDGGDSTRDTARDAERDADAAPSGPEATEVPEPDSKEDVAGSLADLFEDSAPDENSAEAIDRFSDIFESESPSPDDLRDAASDVVDSLGLDPEDDKVSAFIDAVDKYSTDLPEPVDAPEAEAEPVEEGPEPSGDNPVVSADLEDLANRINEVSQLFPAGSEERSDVREIAARVANIQRAVETGRLPEDASPADYLDQQVVDAIEQFYANYPDAQGTTPGDQLDEISDLARDLSQRINSDGYQTQRDIPEPEASPEPEDITPEPEVEESDVPTPSPAPEIGGESVEELIDSIHERVIAADQNGELSEAGEQGMLEIDTFLNENATDDDLAAAAANAREMADPTGDYEDMTPEDRALFAEVAEGIDNFRHQDEAQPLEENVAERRREALQAAVEALRAQGDPAADLFADVVENEILAGDLINAPDEVNSLKDLADNMAAVETDERARAALVSVADSLDDAAEEVIEEPNAPEQPAETDDSGDGNEPPEAPEAPAVPEGTPEPVPAPVPERAEQPGDGQNSPLDEALLENLSNILKEGNESGVDATEVSELLNMHIQGQLSDHQLIDALTQYKEGLTGDLNSRMETAIAAIERLTSNPLRILRPRPLTDEEAQQLPEIDVDEAVERLDEVIDRHFTGQAKRFPKRRDVANALKDLQNAKKFAEDGNMDQANAYIQRAIAKYDSAIADYSSNGNFDDAFIRSLRMRRRAAEEIQARIERRAPDPVRAGIPRRIGAPHPENNRPYGWDQVTNDSGHILRVGDRIVRTHGDNIGEQGVIIGISNPQGPDVYALVRDANGRVHGMGISVNTMVPLGRDDELPFGINEGIDGVAAEGEGLHPFFRAGIRALAEGDNDFLDRLDALVRGDASGFESDEQQQQLADFRSRLRGFLRARGRNQFWGHQRDNGMVQRDLENLNNAIQGVIGGRRARQGYEAAPVAVPAEGGNLHGQEDQAVPTPATPGTPNTAQQAADATPNNDPDGVRDNPGVHNAGDMPVADENDPRQDVSFWERWGDRAKSIVAARRTRPNADALFNARTEQEIQEALKGIYGISDEITFGSKGFTLELYRGYETGRAGNSREFVAEIKIHDADGNTIGDIMRNLTLSSDGKVSAYNNVLKFRGDDGKRSGFATAYNRYMEDWYIANHTDESSNPYVKVHAYSNGSDGWQGGYVWTKNGYRFEGSKQDQINVAQRFVRQLKNNVGRNTDEATKNHIEQLQAKLDRGVPVLPLEIGLVGWRPGMSEADSWLGKQLLLQTDWYGQKDLVPNAAPAIAEAQRKAEPAAQERARNGLNRVEGPDAWVQRMNTQALQGWGLSENDAEQLQRVIEGRNSVAEMPYAVRQAAHKVVSQQIKQQFASGGGRQEDMHGMLQLQRALSHDLYADVEERPEVAQGRAELAAHAFNDLINNPPDGWRERQLVGGVNATRLFINEETGARFIVKIDTFTPNGANNEIAANELLRAFGFEGIPEYARNQGNPEILIIPFVGDGLDLEAFDGTPDGSPVVTASASGLGNGEFGGNRLPLANASQFLDLLVFDALVDNRDRHNGNWMLGRNTNGNHYALPIDHGILGVGRGSAYEMNEALQDGVYRQINEDIIGRLLRMLGPAGLMALLNQSVEQWKSALDGLNLQQFGGGSEELINRLNSMDLNAFIEYLQRHF